MDEVIDLYNQHDIFIQYSHQEGFCNAVLEAQSLGLLCIVSDADGLSENIIHGVTGWIVPKRNPIALAIQIDEVINMSIEKKNEIRMSAIERVKSKFNLEKQRKEFVEFYTS